jgi:hypothetical protein
MLGPITKTLVPMIALRKTFSHITELHIPTASFLNIYPNITHNIYCNNLMYSYCL